MCSILGNKSLARKRRRKIQNSYIFLSFQRQLYKLSKYRARSGETFDLSNPLLFCNKIYNYHHIYKQTKVLLGDSFSPHCFRAFFCTTLKRMKTSVHDISTMLRHKTKSSTGRAVENYLVPDLQTRFKIQKEFFNHLIHTQQP